MDSNYTLIHKIKMQVNKFSGIISKSFSKTKRKLIKEMIYGIQASKDVKLSSISRSLNEAIPLIKTEDRLSRNLDDIDFTEEINSEICRLAANKINEDTVIAIDPGDIKKPYAKKMEYICDIRDGDKKEMAKGYWLCKVVASDLENKDAIPLYAEGYSQNERNFKSANNQIYKAIDTVTGYISNKGIWVADRGLDDIKLYRKLLKEEKRFAIRIKLNRNLIYDKRIVNSGDLGRNLKCPHKSKVVYYKDGKEKVRDIHYNSVIVKLPELKVSFNLVVIRGFGKDPMLILTNLIVNSYIKESVWRIVEIYLTRWKCEESYRYIKQSYNLEDMRVRTYTAIRNIVVLVLAVSYFAAIYIGKNIKLKIMVEKIFVMSKRFFGIPTFYNYAIADGMYNLLFTSKNGIENNIPEKIPKNVGFQLNLPFE